jgi:hypothetical protein
MSATLTTIESELVRLDDRSLIAGIYDLVDKLDHEDETKYALFSWLREAFERFAPEVEALMQTRSIWANESPHQVEAALEYSAERRAERQAERAA